MRRSPKAKRNGVHPAGESLYFERLLWPAWCALTRLLRIDLSRSESTHRLSVTGQCTSLTCVHDPSDWYPGESSQPYNVPAHWILPSLSTLRRRGLCEVTVANSGDKAVRQGWYALCDSRALAPPDFVIINDLTIPMTGDELIGLAHMDSISISLETVEPDLFSQLHNGRSIESILHNMDKVRALVQAQKIPPPEFVFDIEVTSRTVFGLEKTVRLGLDRGVRSFSFLGLYKGSTLRDEFEVFSVLTLSWSHLREALACLERAMAMAREVGCKVQCDPKLYNGILEKLGKLPDLRDEQAAPVTSSQAAVPVPPGMTRNCTLPWTYINICAHGQVRPCSEFRASIGTLREESLAELLNGPKLRQLRKDLLTGRLSEHRCQRCTIMQPVPIATFRRNMRGNLVLWALRRRMLNLLQLFHRS